MNNFQNPLAMAPIILDLGTGPIGEIVPPATSNLLLEDGFKWLLEDGSNWLLEG